ncbi:hypothetical protein ACFXPQ_15770 [Streptomyces lydicus]|uniref:hypothetical protein n=1 Tax=Streptomyces lydicus TaxID=47763 RepID=UPI0036BFBADC
MRPGERAEGVAALVRHVGMMHQPAGRPAPPRPHRLPLPECVEAAPPMRDVALGKHLVEVFGSQGVHRPDADGLYTLAVQCTAPEQNQSLVGTIWAVQPSSGGGRFINRTASAYLRSLALLSTTRGQMQLF